MKTRLHLLLSLILFLNPITKLMGQEKIYFPFFEMINIENDLELQYATSKLLKTYIEENHDYQIIMPSKPDGIYPPEDFLISIQNAKNYSATYLLLGEINNIGTTAIISLSLYEVSSGNRIWSDLIKGLPLDDFDPVLSRIGRNFSTEVKAKDDASIDDITDYEMEQETKLLSYQANTFTGLLMGGDYLLGESFNSRVGLEFYYDISSVILNIDFDISSNAIFNFLVLDEVERDTFMKFTTFDFGMGVNYPFKRTKNTMYATAALDLGVILKTRNNPEVNKSGKGVGFVLGFGYLLGRNSSTNMRFDVSALLPTYKLDNKYIPGIKFGIITSFAPSYRKK